MVWFKRDLRVRDHAPLRAAAEAGLPVVLFFAFEPTMMAAPDWDIRHGRFAFESAEDVRKSLETKGLTLHIVHAEVGEVLGQLSQAVEIHTLFSHQETGNDLSFSRDRAVKRWCRQKGVTWTEFQQDGVVRGLRNRHGWTKQWLAHVTGEQAAIDWEKLRAHPLAIDFFAEKIPLPTSLQERNPAFQPGGWTNGHRYLASFVETRGKDYMRHISKPEASRRSSSRLSPYLAWGCLSMREIFHETTVKAQTPEWKKPIRGFQDRMMWRSHYLQKLESMPAIERANINPGFDALQRSTNEAHFTAWATGQTGFPMVDACMRCLAATGFVNFRMRAMLATFLTFTLNQPWQPGALHLARLFLDYEPGIHYPQFQMHAATSGYHTLRIYNPTTQCERHDPSGDFVRKWVPELAQVPAPQCYEPWKMTALEQAFFHCEIGRDYPAPVVDFESATRAAKLHYWEVRQGEGVKNALPWVWSQLCLPEDIKRLQKSVGKEEVEE